MKSINPILRSVVIVALITVCILFIPLIVMQFTSEMNWDLFDFIVAGGLIFVTGITYKLATMNMGNISYRIALGFTLFIGLFLVWANLAVGIIGSENNPINLLYFVAVLIGVIAAIVVRFQAQKMVRIALMMAIAQVLIAVIALIITESAVVNVQQIVVINGFFAALWIASALLFGNAARIMQKV